MDIVILGPAHPLRGGGMTTFNERLATQFQNEGHDVTIFSFSLQYPSFIFPGSSQYSDEPAPAHLKIESVVNSIAPYNWIKVGNRLKKMQPDLIVVRFWLPLMGPALGTILRRVKKNKTTKIVCIADNIIPHEKRPGDKIFTSYFVKPIDAFITMSQEVMNDLKKFTEKPALLVPHPLYDNFGEKMPMQSAREKLGLKSTDFVLLFFGFIRKYKGLDLLLQAMPIVLKAIPNAKLLVAGEFYDKPDIYNDHTAAIAPKEALHLHTKFISTNEVKLYFSAADVLVQPYREATQSGVSPLAYHFEVPMIVTNVGGLPALVPEGVSGLVAEPTVESIAATIIKFHQFGTAHFKEGLLQEKKKYSWETMSSEIIKLAKT